MACSESMMSILLGSEGSHTVVEMDKFEVFNTEGLLNLSTEGR